jgi:hypothetical protein
LNHTNFNFLILSKLGLATSPFRIEVETAFRQNLNF